jgi:hypothetical protein
MASLPAAVVRAVLGLPSTEQDEARLVLRCSARNGCAGTLGALWLLAWTAMLSVGFRELWAKRELNGFLVLGLVGSLTVVIALFVLRSLLPGDELRIEDGELVVRHRRGLFYKRGRAVAVEDVTNVTVLGAESATPTGYLLVIEAGEDRILFGRGEMTSMLTLWARLLRLRVEQLTRRSLPPDQELEQIEIQRRQRNERITNQAMVAVGVSSSAELANDPERQAEVAKQVRAISIAEASGAPGGAIAQPRSLLAQIGSGILVVFFLVIAGVWILGVVGATIQAFRHPRVVTFLVLPIFWVVTLGFTIAIYSVMKSAIVAVARWLKRMALGS